MEYKTIRCLPQNPEERKRAIRDIIVIITVTDFSLIERVTFGNFTVINSPQRVTMTVGNKVVNITALGDIIASSFSLDTSAFSTFSIAVTMDYPSYYDKTIMQIMFTDATMYFSQASSVFLTITICWILVIFMFLAIAVFVVLTGVIMYLLLWFTACLLAPLA